jgi:glycine/D-amino acid oxidase-like deaminating enzyme
MSNGPSSLSYWFETCGDDLTPRAPLAGSTDVDVVVVGGGLTGLWTAYHLLRDEPSSSVLVVEAETVGFGASGRNGGWCSALYPASLPTLATRHGRQAAIAQYRAMVDNLDDIEQILVDEEIDCDWSRGGTVDLARGPAQLERARAAVDEARRFGFGPDRLALLRADEAARHVRATGVSGATFTPDCAAVHPAKLVRGLARAVERRGGRIVEGTRVVSVSPGRVRTARGDVTARSVLLATEGFTPELPGRRRDVVPVYSLMIATEPLPADLWSAIGLDRRETFTDFRHLIVYGQRTADDRIAFGGRGAPYHFGSRVRPSFDREPAVFEALQRALVELFPALDGVTVTHRWGGPLGVTRDWSAGVRHDPTTGLGGAGGYVGDGVSTTHLAGRTLASLVRGEDTPLTRLPWVGHTSPRWEPEPWRFLGARALARGVAATDAAEARGRRAGLVPTVLDRVLRR